MARTAERIPRGPCARSGDVARLLLLLSLVFAPGCVGSLTAFAALAFGLSVGAYMVSRGRYRLALGEVQTMKLAIASGQHRALEERLRKELALVAAGEAVAVEREWLARAQLGSLLVAEWRFDEAREVYAVDRDPRDPRLLALAQFGRHEVALLSDEVTQDHLDAIRSDRDRCLTSLPSHEQEGYARSWAALEGLCLVRMGCAREAVPLLERGLEALVFHPARVVYVFHLGQAYEHIGERRLAGERYAEATTEFPGTRLASEARARSAALGSGAGGGFRAMLPEAPAQAAVQGSAGGADPGAPVDSVDS